MESQNNNQKILTALNWIRWIAILSVINTIVFSFGNNVSFVIGFGITQVFSGIVASFFGGMWVVILSVLFSLFVAGVFLILEYLGRKQNKWAMLFATLLYALDTLLFLLIGDYLSLGFHIYAGYFLVVGTIEFFRK